MVVHCKMGGRSAKAVALLQERGFTRVRNLKGGILAWIDRVDPTQSVSIEFIRSAGPGRPFPPESRGSVTRPIICDACAWLGLEDSTWAMARLDPRNKTSVALLGL